MRDRKNIPCKLIYRLKRKLQCPEPLDCRIKESYMPPYSKSTGNQMKPNQQVNGKLCNKTNPAYLHELQTDNHGDKLPKEFCPENEKSRLEIRHQHCAKHMKPKAYLNFFT